jgi:hypothetical protein
MTAADPDRGSPATRSRAHILEPCSLPQYVDRLYRAAWGMCGSREDAEDLVQETFACVLSRRRVVRRDDDLHYLLRALRNTFHTNRRRAGRRPATTATLGEVVAADPSPSTRQSRPYRSARCTRTSPHDLRACVWRWWPSTSSGSRTDRLRARSECARRP